MQKRKGARAEASLLELCRATQHFNYETSKCKGVRAETNLLELCRATQHFDDGTSKCKNAKMQRSERRCKFT